MDVPESFSDSSLDNAEEGVLAALLKDVMRMATYAVEVGRLPQQVKFSELYRLWDQKIERSESLSVEDIDLIENYYRLLEDELAPVTAVSLFATNAKKNSRNLKDYVNTEAGKHARHMWYLSFFILALIMGINLFQYIFHMLSADWAIDMKENFVYITILYWLAAGITPFAYGAFGACVRLLRVTEQRLRDRSFDPRRIPEHRNRMVLGTLSGGVIVLLYSSGGVGETDIKLTEAALGFLAGYSIDLLFSLIDRLVKAISPDTPTTPVSKSKKTETERVKEQNRLVAEKKNLAVSGEKQADIAKLSPITNDEKTPKGNVS